MEAVKLRQHLVVQRHLIAADRAPVGRVKGENDRATPELAEGDELVGGTRQSEFGRGRAGCERRGRIRDVGANRVGCHCLLLLLQGNGTGDLTVPIPGVRFDGQAFHCC